MAKPTLLYLCHRIPYPPNKGDKIRSFNLLKALCRDYDVYLGCFIDDPFDWQYEQKLAQWCVEYRCIHQHKLRSKLKGLWSFVSGQPITLPYYASRALQHWVDDVIKRVQPDTVLVFSSAMAQFVDQSRYQSLHKVIDLVDVDSDKWRQYADNHRGLMRWIYQREHRLLARYEQACLANFAHTLLVSADEARLFQQMSPPALQPKIQPLLNGVDTVFFDPTVPLEWPAGLNGAPYLVFTGAMDYWANVDAVCWFVREVWPSLKAARPELAFYIVGGNPTAEVEALQQQGSIFVTGRVQDVRPYIAGAALVVAPLRIARGIQNKVLEAMAMAKPIVATHMAMEGINAPTHHALQQSDDAATFATLCLQLLASAPPGQINRDWVLANFTWQATLKPLQSWLTADDRR